MMDLPRSRRNKSVNNPNLFNARIVRENEIFNDSLCRDVATAKNPMIAATMAKSILSVSIMKVLQPLSNSHNMAITTLCENIINNLNLETFIGYEIRHNIIESLLYNEFYKVALLVSTHKRSHYDIHNEVVEVIEALGPTIDNIKYLIDSWRGQLTK